jgi:hypothetical protein
VIAGLCKPAQERAESQHRSAPSRKSTRTNDGCPDGRLFRKAITATKGISSTAVAGCWWPSAILGCILGPLIYIHRQAKTIIVRMASEATPLDPDGVRGGFGIAEHFL